MHRHAPDFEPAVASVSARRSTSGPEQRRAPQSGLQGAGLEWLHRLVSEPLATRAALPEDK